MNDLLKDPLSAKSNNNFSESSIIFSPGKSIFLFDALSMVVSEIFINSLLTCMS